MARCGRCCVALCCRCCVARCGRCCVARFGRCCVTRCYRCCVARCGKCCVALTTLNTIFIVYNFKYVVFILFNTPQKVWAESLLAFCIRGGLSCLLQTTLFVRENNEHVGPNGHSNYLWPVLCEDLFVFDFLFTVVY